MAKQQDLWIMCVVNLLIQWATNTAQSQCVPLLPEFRDQGPRSPALLVGIQAIVPAYRITCNGTLIRWGISTEKRGQHDIHLQVWRPTDGYRAYSLAGVNTFNVQPPKQQKAFQLTPKPRHRIMVQVGDILGFHLVNNETIGDDFSIQYHANTSGINVHYMQIAQPLQEIQFNTLHVTLMNAAPIIHIEIDSIPFPDEGTNTSRPSTASTPTNTGNSFPTTETDVVTTVHDPGRISPNETDTTTIDETTTQSTNDKQFIIILSAFIGTIVGVIIISVTVVAIVIRCTMKRIGHEKQTQAVENEEIRVEYTSDEYDYTRGHVHTHSPYAAVILPPQSFKKHPNKDVIVPLKENPAYDQTQSLAHEYETPVMMVPTRSTVRGSHGYDTPRGTRVYLNVGHDYEDI